MAWYNESRRHSKAARGIPTGRKCPVTGKMHFADYKSRFKPKRASDLGKVESHKVAKDYLREQKAKYNASLSKEQIADARIESDIKDEKDEHPWLTWEQAKQVVKDHKRKADVPQSKGIYSGTGIMSGMKGVQEAHQESHKSMFDGIGNMTAGIRGFTEGLGIKFDELSIKARHIFESKPHPVELEVEGGKKRIFYEGGTEATRRKRYEQLETRAMLAERGVTSAPGYESEAVGSPKTAEEEAELDKEVEKIYEQEGVRKL